MSILNFFPGFKSGFQFVNNIGGFPAQGSVLDYDFRNNRYSGPDLSVSRTSDAYAVGEDGRYQVFAPNVMRREFTPKTPRTNFIRNNTMQGLVVGSPGSLPTNWASINSSGIARQVLGSGTEGGIDYIDVRFSGTLTGNLNGSGILAFEAGNVTPASSGQLWTGSVFASIQAGSVAASTLTLGVVENDSAGGGLVASTAPLSVTGGPLTASRVSVSRTYNNASTANTVLRLQLTAASGSAVDFTIRLGLPQLELASAATDPIRTYGVAGSADIERRNAIRNNTMQGVVAGSPGTLPTNWSGSFASSGLTQTVVGVGIEQGVDYLDVRVQGTTTAITANVIFFGSNTFETIGAPSQLWANSTFVKLVSGSFSNVQSLDLTFRESDNSGAFLRQTLVSVLGATGATLTRVVGSATTGTSTAQLTYGIRLAAGTGATLDFTIRVGLPQLEQSAYATDPIRTTGAAVTVGPGNSGSLGLLVEGAQTNSIRNNSMQGAVAGSPGTLPTNWTLNSGNGVSSQVIGAGTENGIDYIDLRFSGTATAAGNRGVNFEGNNTVAAVNGQLWSISSFMKLSAGSLPSGGVKLLNVSFDSSNAQLSTSQSVSQPITNSPLGTQRKSFSATLTDSTTAFLRPGIVYGFANAEAVDFTLRIGWPQLEQWNAAVTTVGGASSPIRTTSSAVTRAAEVVTGTLGVGLTDLTAALTVNLPSFVTGSGGYIGIGSSTDKVDIRSGGATPSQVILAPTVGNTGQTTAATAGGVLVVGRTGIAGAVQAGSIALSLSGTAPITAAPTSTPTGVTGIRLGAAVSGGNTMFGYIERVSILPRRASNLELQQFSTLTS